MPWKETSKKEARHEFVVAVMKRGKRSFAEVCGRFGIGRSCGYRWWQRFREGGQAGLEDRSRRPQRAQALRDRWLAGLLQLRAKHPTWGGAKLHVLLGQGRREARPAVCTLERWLRQAGRTRRRIRHARRGPLVPSPPRQRARQPNDVWTIDFKGDFEVGAGQRVRALTVRDTVSRYVLAVQHLRRPDDRGVRRVMRRLFRRYGLPRALHMDNGSPFASEGPLGLSRLSVWWLQLGIRVSRSRRGCPQDNPSHEQMHGVLKKDTARPPAYTLAAQQRRLVAWRHRYNHVRPHAALRQRTPATLYRPSARRLPPRDPAWPYPPKSEILLVGRNGRAWWRNAQRLIGRAFAQQRLRLQSTSPDSANVWLGPHLIGTLHSYDSAGLRPAHYSRASVHEREGAPPLPQPSPSSK
jgi:transposase InsO family protein